MDFSLCAYKTQHVGNKNDKNKTHTSHKHQQKKEVIDRRQLTQRNKIKNAQNIREMNSILFDTNASTKKMISIKLKKKNLYIL